MLEIWETPLFTRQILADKTDEEYRELQVELVANPEMGVLIPGTGGLRKIRWKAEGRGKRGGYRLIYYWAVSPAVILMLFMYPKNARGDLSPEQKKALRRAVDEAFGRVPG